MVLHTIKEKLQELVRRLAASAQELHRVPSLTAAAMLAAVALVLNQFTIAVSQFLEIGFTFLAAGVCAFLFGPWMAGLMGIVTDLIGYFLRPNGGFFPGFTLNEFLLGFLYGCWLYKKPPSWRRTFAACLSADNQPVPHPAVAEYAVRTGPFPQQHEAD